TRRVKLRGRDGTASSWLTTLLEDDPWAVASEHHFARKAKAKRGLRRDRTDKQISKIKRIPDVAWQLKSAEEDRHELANQTTWSPRNSREPLDKWIRRAEAAPRRWMSGQPGYTG